MSKRQKKEGEMPVRFYTLSLLASRLGNTEQGEPPLVISHTAGYTPAASDEEAERIGKEQALSIWPESNGWDGHSVKVYAPKLGMLKKITALMSEEAGSDESLLEQADSKQFVM
jgi:hypothetical protein